MSNKAENILIDLFHDIREVPVLPSVGMKLISLFKSESVSNKELSKIIAEDPVISAKVVKLANSAYYSIRNKVSTVSHAVGMLGAETIKQMVLNLCFLELTKKTTAGIEISLEPFWHHAIATSIISARLAKYLAFQIVGPGEAHLAGLLHDIGLYILFRYKPEIFQSVYLAHINKKQPLNQCESEVFGVDHSDIGAWLVEKWGLPNHLSESVRFHHNLPQEPIYKELVALIHTANVLANRLEIRFDQYSNIDTLHPIAAEIISRKMNIPVTHTIPKLEFVVADSLGNIEGMIKDVFPTKAGIKEEKEEEALSDSKSSNPIIKIDNKIKNRDWVRLVPGLKDYFEGKMNNAIIKLTVFVLGTVFSFLAFRLDLILVSVLFFAISILVWALNWFNWKY